MSEAAIQTAICDALKHIGYDVQSTSTYRKPGYGHGASKKGLPDVLVSHTGWPAGLWLGLEVKKPKHSKKSAEQDELESRGRIIVVRSLDEAIEAVRGIELE